MNPDLRVLTLKHYGETPSEDLEVTLSPLMVKAVLAKDILVQDRPVKETTVIFLDSEPLMFNLNSLDLITIQNVVGSYGFFEQ